jgi:predicted dehydrogenase
MICYDDLEPSEKVKVYDRGVLLSNGPEGLYTMRVGYRTGDMWAPQLDLYEALQQGVAHFVECIQTGQTPVTDGRVGLQVVRLLEAATQSLARRGALIEIATHPAQA